MATTTNYSWTTPDDTALVKDGAAAIRSLGTAIDTTVFANAGAAIAKATVDAKGDLIAGTADNTVARLAVGANDTILVADSSTATGLKWAAPAGGGKVLQVISGVTSTSTGIFNSTFTDTTITATITPTLATSKILIMIMAAVDCDPGGDRTTMGTACRIDRGGTVIYTNNRAFLQTQTNNMSRFSASINFVYLDSPATTSATTYKLQGTGEGSSPATYYQRQGPSTITLLEIGA